MAYIVAAVFSALCILLSAIIINDARRIYKEINDICE